MKIITLNVNGLRAAVRRGLFDWLLLQKADIICIQETKLQDAQLTPNYYLPGYYCEYAHAEKKGYSGVAIFARERPERVTRSLGFETADTEGRYIQFDYPNFSVASIYFPSGTSGEHRQTIKMSFLEKFEKQLVKLRASKRKVILCGDYNIAHQKIDLKNWQANQKHTGFLPEERAWMDQLFGPLGFRDAFRVCHPEAAVYTWWSYRAKAWEKDVGWRIDYQVVTKNVVPLIKSASVSREPRFSDHAPLSVEYDL